MDDEVIGCGGTLARHVAGGAEVTIIFLTDGRQGGVAPTAGAVTEGLDGAGDRRQLDLPDGRSN